MQEKPHKCECGRSFPTPADLRAHGYSHIGNWPLRCPVCNRGFCKLGALHHHMKSHGNNNTLAIKNRNFILLYLLSIILIIPSGY
ncbi:Zinc finger and SCAN domain-containing protein 20 [Temnothorax longispinosus]|uniref:Zinc finger and SCAN domain-containing protein 20 n=1 Tax=Temnothorax longispinosus TaxID=300112 RepID=A0A4S2KZW3_9HYME|nr:Zinc finger and SCAN domain-containing protein 20 [Temnothorax longispinosus]